MGVCWYMPFKSKGTVLVIDDDASLLRGLSRLLLAADENRRRFG
jgi:hypothetical protein